MNFQISEHFHAFINKQIESGHFSNPNEVVQTALELLEKRELQKNELKGHIEASIERGGENSQEDVIAKLGLEE